MLSTSRAQADHHRQGGLRQGYAPIVLHIQRLRHELRLVLRPRSKYDERFGEEMVGTSAPRARHVVAIAWRNVPVRASDHEEEEAEGHCIIIDAVAKRQ